ncbi:pilin [Halobacteria archaeon AArc-curdl1]|uniref:Pilin n=1 Tax=Natronosalvus hydrolyticus TaxID=2979988 RepID=A0AAP2ZAI4_9EURY|nr:pilin [Halobacteria archaeon AArc-curdl1]
MVQRPGKGLYEGQKLAVKNRLYRHGTIAVIALLLWANPVAASHENAECPPPEEFLPLLEFLHSVEQLGVVIAFALLTVVLIAAGVSWMIPGEDWNRRAKQILKNGLAGFLLVLMAPMMSAFMIGAAEGVWSC